MINPAYLRQIINKQKTKLMETTVKAVKYKDVRDKEQLYVVITKGEKKAIINVGQKTYDSVVALDIAEGEVQTQVLDLPDNNKTEELPKTTIRKK